ncbi:MAG: hypothetical protein ACI93H_001692, partial [Psychromonas sp.]
QTVFSSQSNEEKKLFSQMQKTWFFHSLLLYRGLELRCLAVNSPYLQL